MLGGVPSFLFVLAAIAAYPWLFLPTITAGVVAYIVDREYRRRKALAARADWEHRALVAAPIRWPERRPRVPRRPADHWSVTQPIRSG
ncbi:hypothetical protein B1987_13650 [Mycobacterium kansasii]|uniref:Uncharacterized protein n=1 Tax=Mycobacterium attenuatum TaxID=2341086 RepID=A0A498QGS9_9MYCO|nr:hypothetical protein [Mycobacterium attenuatum]ORB84667.1 hypothetical protein B1987_13650 [Mycobacterium kansasii]VBA43944.1 hypothetical protein LAUMK136_05350 [Mycobacterium attenuatum]